MFDIGFWELSLIFIIGLLVLGPERLPIAVRKVLGLIRSIKATASSLGTELSNELKVSELHNDLKKAEQLGMKNLSQDLQDSVESLKQAAASVNRPYANDGEFNSEPSPSGKEDSGQTGVFEDSAKQSSISFESSSKKSGS